MIKGIKTHLKKNAKIEHTKFENNGYFLITPRIYFTCNLVN